MSKQHFFESEFSDRGMMKWGGFILSEHTTLQETIQKQEIHPLPKQQMSREAISDIIELALTKHQEVSIQREAITLDGNYFPSIKGFISGYDALGLYIHSTKVDYDEIRHIELLTQTKWYNTLNE